MDIPSYRNKTFRIADPDARIRRDDVTTFATYEAGEVLPAGKRVGDCKVIPQGTEVLMTRTQIDAARHVFACVHPKVANPAIPSGWTKATNFAGSLVNELLGFEPAIWDVPPHGNNYTVTDAQALIRTGPPNFMPTGGTIPLGAYVVREAGAHTGASGRFVRVYQASINNGQVTAGAEIGWTATTNLTDGCSQYFRTAAWTDPQGPNACWRQGQFIGARVLVHIVGFGGQAEQITLDSIAPYTQLQEAAAQANLTLAIESAFRTYASQAALYQLYQAGQGNLAAAPGTSNHQHGQAFDLNTGDFDSPLYVWLTEHAPRFGFIRTVNKEHWHWEYRADEAVVLAAQGRFRLDSVTV
jgi:hypothetical protein